MFHTLKMISAGIHYWQILWTDIVWKRRTGFLSPHTCSRTPSSCQENTNANLLPWISSSLSCICLSVWWLIYVDNGEILNTGMKSPLNTDSASDGGWSDLNTQSAESRHKSMQTENPTYHTHLKVFFLFFFTRKCQFAHLQKKKTTHIRLA